MTELAEQAFLPPASLTRLVDHLVDDNLLYRRVDDIDRRRIRAYLTSRGRRLHQRISQELRDNLTALHPAGGDQERLGQLAAQQLIRRERDPRDRRDRYVLDDQLWYHAWLASARMNDVLADAAGDGVAVLGAGTPAGARLHEMSRFLRDVGRDMVRAAERWGSDRAIDLSARESGR